ncbi:hypothetical protein IQ219_11270 [Synechocystis sp. LEGE 06083]|uniref:hypothetical protein n=1 Tax=Synechocystis sp. LEGE 06083 TaxID=915336 RepID=UPI001882F780|nr:hypothetical protein [Synechocystis sp. LEGE 06083]MBE9195870.1 hypothetical protein [Synechocystis sp. LEGE 06083]
MDTIAVAVWDNGSTSIVIYKSNKGVGKIPQYLARVLLVWELIFVEQLTAIGVAMPTAQLLLNLGRLILAIL